MEVKNGILLIVTNDDIGEDGEFIVPEGVTKIGYQVFMGCESLKSIKIHDSVKSIGEGAFWGCKSLTSVIIPSSVTEIGKWAFADCKILASVNIPNSVTKIGIYAFAGCESLTSITFPEGLTEIGEGAFADCKSLTSVNIPNSVTSIGDGAFWSCKSLTSITIPNGVTSIGVGAFEWCVQLKSKPSYYKAFQIKDGELRCLKKKYREGVKNFIRGELELCKRGIHYCTNLFEIFNFYCGELDKDIAIYEIEVGDKVLTSRDDSKCCTNSCVLKKRLSREEVIRILNGEAE